MVLKNSLQLFQAPGCNLPATNGITVPTFIENPIDASNLEKETLLGWDEMIDQVRKAAS